MKKNKPKRLIALLMSSIMLLGILPVLPEWSITAYAAEPEVKQFATKNQLMTEFGLDTSSNNIGHIKFGVDGREWLIAGEDTENGTLALLSTSSFDSKAYGSESKYSTSEVKTLLEDYSSDKTYFSDGEQDYMEETTVSTVEYDGTERTASGKLYLPDAKNRNSSKDTNIYVGTNNDIPIALGNLTDTNGFTASSFWLRSPDSTFRFRALVALPGVSVDRRNVSRGCAVVPAFNLNLSSVIFASAANAASSEGELTVDDAFTLRYESNDLGSATINPEQTSVTVSDVSPHTYLVVQNDSDAWAKALDGNTTILADDVAFKGIPLTSFDNCKVWLEKTDADRITTATMATVKSDYRVQVTSGSHMTKTSDSGADTQDVNIGSAMDNVVYKAESGYYFPLNYGQDINGIIVARIDSTHISVSGWPTANTEIELPNASTISERSTVVTSKKNINFRADVLTTDYDDTWASGDAMVYYGQYNGDPVLCRVLEADERIALLDSDTALYAKTFNNSWQTANAAQRSEKPNEYNGSDLQADLNGTGFYNKTDVFTSAEKAAILQSYLGGADLYEAGRHNFSYTDYPAYTYIFPLSASESVNYYGTDAVAKKNSSNAVAYWWLRSASAYSSSTAGAVDYDGWLSINDVDDSYVGVAPAFNLNLPSVLFTSASEASKSSFAEVGNDKVTNTWKLTLSDGNTGFTATRSDTTTLVAGEDNEIQITGISGATNDYTQISAALVNKNDEVLCYGMIAAVGNNSATVTIPGANLADDETYTLQVFAEKVNGDKETDYASNMVSIQLNVEKQWKTISVDAPPTTNYIEGNTFDPTGLVIAKNYSVGSKDTVEYSETTKDHFSFVPSIDTELEKNNETITIRYTEGEITKQVDLEIDVSAKSMDSISISKEPKISYMEGETFDPTGLELTLKYNNGTTEPIAYNEDSEAAFSFNPNLTAGLTTDNKIVEISYGGKTVEQEITVQKQVEAVIADPQPGTYTEAQQVTLTSETDRATIHYTKDSSEPTVNSEKYTGVIKVASTQTIKAIAVKDGMANSKVSTFEYIIKQNPTAKNLACDLSTVNYNKSPIKLKVTAKDGEDLGAITVKYNGSTDIPVNAGTYEIIVDVFESDLWNSAMGISLGKWTIAPKSLTNVSAVIPDVKQDSALNLENQILVLHSEAIEEGDSVSGTCKVTLGSTSATGNYQDAKVEVKGVNNPNYTFTETLNEQSYTVTEKTLTSIKITTPPKKNTYFAGEVFNMTGMVVTAYYDSGDPVVLESNEYSISPSGGLTSSDDKITVSYGGMTDTTSITVKEVELTDIIIEKVPNKTEYIIGQSFSDIGMVVKAKYNNGTKQVISGYSFSPDDALTTVGTQDITISYTEGGITKEAIQQVNVIAKVVTSIDVISQPTQRNYVEGQKLSLSGLVVNLTYNDESSQEVAIDKFESLGITTSIANGTVLSVGEHNGKAITVTCEGINVKTESLTVVAKAVTGLEIMNPPKQLSYTAGEALDLSGLIVTLIYNNGHIADVDYADFEAAGITVNYKDGDILTNSDNGSSILVTYNEISVSAGELLVSPRLYQITIGAGSTYEIGSNNPILFICSGSLRDLTGVYVDGKLLDTSNYTVKSGSTILTLNKDYLDGLPVGTHSLRFEYLYGSAETTFKVVEAKQAETDAKNTTTPTSKTTTKTGTSAKTGDTTSVMLWVTLVLLSGIASGGFIWYRRKRRRK